MRSIYLAILFFCLLALPVYGADAAVDTPIGAPIELGSPFPAPYQCLYWAGGIGDGNDPVALFASGCPNKKNDWIYPKCNSSGVCVFKWYGEKLVIKREGGNANANEIQLYKRTP